VKDAVEIYVNQLQPLLKKIRETKYSSNRVELENNIYYLTQEKFTIEDIESAGVLPEVLEFHLGSGNRTNQAKTRKARDTITQNKTKKNRGGSSTNDFEEEEQDDE